MKNLNFPYNLFDLKNKTIVLTGSAGRLGSRFANVLSSAGGKVVLVDVDSRKNKKLQTEIERKYKYMPLMYNVDFSNEESVELFVEDILKKEKHIDVLINNAHFVPRAHPHRDASFEDYPFDLWNKTISVNLGGLFLCCKKVGKVMTKQKIPRPPVLDVFLGANKSQKHVCGVRKNPILFFSGCARLATKILTQSGDVRERLFIVLKIRSANGAKHIFLILHKTTLLPYIRAIKYNV